MSKDKIFPELYIPKDLLTQEDLEEVADRVINGNEMLGDIVEDYDCCTYTLNRYITVNDEIRERFIDFIENVNENVYGKDKSKLSEYEIKQAEIVNEICEINEKAKDADIAIPLLNNMSSREVARQLGISKTKMYNTLKEMGFEYNKFLKQWLHVDSKDTPKHVEELKRDLELIDLYTHRYGDFGLYGEDFIIKMVDAEIMEDVRALAHNLNYETEDDLMNVLILRGLQNIDYRKNEGIKKENKVKFDLIREDHLNFLMKGPNNWINEIKDKLISEYGTKKSKLDSMTDEQIFMLYKSKTK